MLGKRDKGQSDRDINTVKRDEGVCFGVFFLWANMKQVNFSLHVKCKTNDWMLGCEG